MHKDAHSHICMRELDVWQVRCQQCCPTKAGKKKTPRTTFKFKFDFNLLFDMVPAVWGLVKNALEL